MATDTIVITREQWEMLVEQMHRMENKIDKLAPLSTTERLEKNDDEIFIRLRCVEGFNAKLLGVVSVLSILFTLAVSWLGKYVWDKCHQIKI